MPHKPHAAGQLSFAYLPNVVMVADVDGLMMDDVFLIVLFFDSVFPDPDEWVLFSTQTLDPV